MKTPIAILFFNRPEVLMRLILRLAEVQPKKLYLVCDGARQGKSGEHEKVLACQRLFEKLPWTCEIQRNYSSINLGCRQRIVSGLDWVFTQEEEAIILEDDCVPEPEFFPWVERMLDRYQGDDNVLSIGGTNLRPQLCNQAVDCVFTKYAMIWGWATWRRAWQCMDKDLAGFPEACDRHLFKKWLGKWRSEWYWRYLLTHVKSSWGYRWAFTHFLREVYCVLPPVNLVKNIGMADLDATHTSRNPYQLPPVEKGWQKPNNEPICIVNNVVLDRWIDDHFYSRSLAERIKWMLVKLRR